MGGSPTGSLPTVDATGRSTSCESSVEEHVHGRDPGRNYEQPALSGGGRKQRLYTPTSADRRREMMMRLRRCGLANDPARRLPDHFYERSVDFPVRSG